MSRLKEELGFRSDVSHSTPMPGADEVRYSVTCHCGHDMKVRPKHFGRMCRCTRCTYPIYVTYDNVTPPVHPLDRKKLRYFKKEDEVPLEWESGDLLMESYEVRRKIGGGGMGVVYKVFHRGWGMTVAVKSPKKIPKASRRWVEFFEHECETWINLAPHPNVVGCFYVRRLGGIPRVFVEFIPGHDLEHRIFHKTLYDGGHAVALEHMLDVAIQFAWGLHHAHTQGVTHRDVKPSNLLVSEDWRAKVTDFGLANVWASREGYPDSGSAGPLSTPGGTAAEGGNESGNGQGSSPPASRRRSPAAQGGTRAYRSPDPLDMPGQARKSDIWSFGVSLLEMFAGEVFWKNYQGISNSLEWVRTNGARDRSVPPLPARVYELIKHCCAMEPEDRPNSMLAVADELVSIYGDVCHKTYEREYPQVGETTAAMVNNRAVSFIDLGMEREAEQLWRQVLETNPDHLEAAYNLMLRQWRTGRLTDVAILEALLKRRASEPDGWQAAYLAARVLMERGDCARAIEILEKIPEEQVGHREVSFALAMAQNLRSRDKRVLWQCQSGSPRVTAIAIAADGWKVFTGGCDGKIRGWEVSAGRCETACAGHEDAITALALSVSEKTLLSGGADGLLKLWDASTGHCLRTLEGHEGGVTCAALSHDGKIAVSGSHDATLKAWDTQTGQCLQTLRDHQLAVTSLSLSGCGQYVMSGSRDQSIRLWNVRAGKAFKGILANRSAVSSVYLSENRLKALTSNGRKIKLWDMRTGTRLRSIIAHEADVASVAVFQEGGYALSATDQGTMKLWDVNTGQCLRTLKGNAPAVISRNGRYGVSAAAGGEFCVWTLHCTDEPFRAPFQVVREEI